MFSSCTIARIMAGRKILLRRARGYAPLPVELTHPVPTILALGATEYKRVAHLRPFQLPGGEATVKEPRRSALGLLYEIFGEQL
jgi:hydrogenase maturation factor HypF (carbamoyltransferase family)